MQKLFYFRKLYEYEKQHDHAQMIRNYINGSKINLLKDFCTGKLNLPSPFLLDEIEWGLNVSDNRIKERIYQLRIISRKFYTSLSAFESGKYRTHFIDTSTALGQKIVSDLIELRLYNTGNHNALLNRGRISLYKIFLFSTHYPNIFRGLYGASSIWSVITTWNICIALDINNPYITFLFSSIIFTLAVTGAFTIEKKMNIFEYSDITGKNLLAMRYKELITMLKYSPHTTSPPNSE